MPDLEKKRAEAAAEALAKGREAGSRQDYAEAMRWYRIAADQGNARANYNIGVLYERGWGVTQDYAETMRWYRKAAEQGDVFAQFNIGGLYTNGWGVAQNDAEATRWYRKAADQGYAPGQLNVGVAYVHGWGVAEDDAEAMRWFRMAANQGEPGAQFNMGLLYHYGAGVAQDEGQALAWITKAATSGLEKAKNWLTTAQPVAPPLAVSVPPPGPPLAVPVTKVGETYTDPHAYCRAVGTIDEPDRRYVGPKQPKSFWHEFDLEEGHGMLEWRCMDGAVYACGSGNSPICDKLDPYYRLDDIKQFCRENPQADIVPSVVMGHQPVGWVCENGTPVLKQGDFRVDKRGYPVMDWKLMWQRESDTEADVAAPTKLPSTQQTDAEKKPTDADNSLSEDDDSLFPSYDQPTIAQITYCFSQPANPPSGSNNRGSYCTSLRTTVKYHDAFLVRWFGSSAYSSYYEYLAMCPEIFCMDAATAFAIHNRLSGTRRPATPPPSPFATLLAKKTLITVSEAIATCLGVVDQIEGANSLVLIGGKNKYCDSVATVAVAIHKDLLENLDVTRLPSLAARGSFIGEEAQKNCLELTRVAANSTALSSADRDWCREFGNAAGKFALEKDQAAPGMETSPSKMTHEILIALIDQFIAAHPEEANQPLAAKMMHTLAWLYEKAVAADHGR